METSLLLSRKQWETIGEKAGWVKVAQSSGWDRFADFIDVWTWDEIVETGKANEIEEDAIISLGYYESPVTEESINRLKNGIPKPEGLSVIYRGIDGKDETNFSSKEEMSDFVTSRLGADARDVTETGFGTDYAEYYLNGATMSDLGIDISGYSQDGIESGNGDDGDGYDQETFFAEMGFSEGDRAGFRERHEI